MPDIIRILIVAVASGGIAAGIGVILQRRRARRLQRVDRLECSVRVVTGTHDGLSGKWWAGEAMVSPGRVHFVPVVGGVRFLRRKAVEIIVDKIEVNERRSPTGREVLSVDPGTDVVRLVTPTATLEWAVLERQMNWALDRLSATDQK
ncbi:hypothetical protein BS329_01650 [Amycolatopsis coloradensis]|uniref:Uncharacterized protein n=1 Tax=Amycolatopsis coloradensis TaxID=76021 RepID=A0A1R0L497_9PSEU|nr:hypothetical protein [Amycolatopsis coloradensis]OLZ57402.1 hypothetical protein BS329_01650 [Amycolatopsis coloradensis]